MCDCGCELSTVALHKQLRVPMTKKSKQKSGRNRLQKSQNQTQGETLDRCPTCGFFFLVIRGIPSRVNASTQMPQNDYDFGIYHYRLLPKSF